MRGATDGSEAAPIAGGTGVRGLRGSRSPVVLRAVRAAMAPGHARGPAWGVTAAGTGVYAAGCVQSGGHGQVR